MSAALATAMRQRVDLLAARRVIAAAHDATRSLGAAWVPQVTVSGGLEVAHAPDTTAVGYVASLGIELPTAARGQDVRADARAIASLAAARAESLTADVRREVLVSLWAHPREESRLREIIAMVAEHDPSQHVRKLAAELLGS